MFLWGRRVLHAPASLSPSLSGSYEANFPQQYSLKEKFTSCEGNMHFLIIIIILCLPREGEEGGASLLNRERNFPVSVPRIDTLNSAILISSHPSAAGWDQLIQIFYSLVTLCTKISLCTTQLFLLLCSAKHRLSQQYLAVSTSPAALFTWHSPLPTNSSKSLSAPGTLHHEPFLQYLLHHQGKCQIQASAGPQEVEPGYKQSCRNYSRAIVPLQDQSVPIHTVIKAHI